MGERLFDRTPGGVFPTAAGAAFLTPARRALCEMSAAAVEAGRAARGETGRLRLGFISSALLQFLPSVLPPFRRDHPDVRLELREMSTARSAAALISGELDLAIGRGAPRGPGERSPVLAAFLAETRRRSTVGARPGRTKRSARKGPGANDSP